MEPKTHEDDPDHLAKTLYDAYRETTERRIMIKLYKWEDFASDYHGSIQADSWRAVAGRAKSFFQTAPQSHEH